MKLCVKCYPLSDLFRVTSATLNGAGGRLSKIRNKKFPPTLLPKQMTIDENQFVTFIVGTPLVNSSSKCFCPKFLNGHLKFLFNLGVCRAWNYSRNLNWNTLTLNSLVLLFRLLSSNFWTSVFFYLLTTKNKICVWIWYICEII